jgi:hypothetical protein
MEELIEKAQNKSADYIKTCHIYLIECIRQYISRFLSTQKDQMYTNLVLHPEESQGLADVYKPHVDIYQSNDGIIYFEFDSDWNAPEGNYLELDEVQVDILVDIVEAIGNL